MKFAKIILCLLMMGCKPPAGYEPPPPPQITATELPNNTFQFQWDNGDPMDMADFLPALNKWLIENPDKAVISTIPQTTYRTVNGKQVSTTFGVLIFTIKKAEITPKGK